MAKIYGVDTTKKVTPIMVRDAMIKCFKDAHKEVLDEAKDSTEFESDADFEKMKDIHIKVIIETKIHDFGGDFKNPTKIILKKTCDFLAEYAKNFRQPKIIKIHYDEIMTLVKLLD
jgi:hypothetical protein